MKKNNIAVRIITAILLMSFLIILCGIGFESIPYSLSSDNSGNTIIGNYVITNDSIQTLQINESNIRITYIRSGRVSKRSVDFCRYLIILIYSIILISGITSYYYRVSNIRQTVQYIIYYIHDKDGRKRYS